MVIQKVQEVPRTPSLWQSCTTYIASFHTNSVRKSVGQNSSCGDMAQLSLKRLPRQQNLPTEQDCYQQENSTTHSKHYTQPYFTVNGHFSNVPWRALYIRHPPPWKVGNTPHLNPSLRDIVNCTFYWGTMSHSQASRLLGGMPGGTFLLRDSEQKDYLFSVSYSDNGRAKAFRIQQTYQYTSKIGSDFDVDTVFDIIESYRRPNPRPLHFHPEIILKTPLHHTFPFSLKTLARAAICDRCTSDDIHQLPIPRLLKEYLQEHYY